jgi:hypothetical protein
MITVYSDDYVEVIRDPNAGKHQLSLLKHIYVEEGTIDDWYTLQELHYKGHTLAAGSRFIRCVYEENDESVLIGIIVFANPRILDRDRMRVFPHMYPNRNGSDTTLMNKHRIIEGLNKHFTWNNRTVLDTMYRSAGIAYRFKNLAYRMYCCQFRKTIVESRSSMGKFNPFSIKAGMKFTKPTPANALEVGIAFFRANFVSPPMDAVALMEEMAAMPPALSRYIEKKLRVFYYKNSSMEKSGDKRDLGMSRVNELSLGYIIRQTQQLVFGETVYWVWGPNPDRGKTLPQRIPILAFDNQGVMEPLRLDLLEDKQCH